MDEGGEDPGQEGQRDGHFLRKIDDKTIRGL